MKKILLVLFGLTLSFLIAELFLRLQSRTTLKLYDNEIYGHAYVPSQAGWFVPSTREYKTWVEINSHGWPDIEHSYEKPEGVKRIVILGDSFVENTQMPLEKRFFRLLQEKLGNQYEIIAIGRGNTGTAQQYLILKNYALKYEPDLVIQMFLEANDVKNNSPVLQQDQYLPYFEINSNDSLVEVPHSKRPERKLAGMKEFLKNFRLVEFLLSVRQNFLERKSYKENDYPLDYHVYDKNYSDEYQKAWEVTKNLILKTKEEIESTGAKYVLVVIPGIEQVEKIKQEKVFSEFPMMKDNIDFDKPDKILSEFCATSKINCYSTLSDFRKSDEETYNFYEGHWNQKGVNLIAEFLASQLESLQTTSPQ